LIAEGVISNSSPVSWYMTNWKVPGITGMKSHLQRQNRYLQKQTIIVCLYGSVHVTRSNVSYDIRIKTTIFLVGSYFICYLYLFTYIWCQISFPNHMMFVFNCNTRVPLVEQELLTLPKHLSSPRLLVLFVLLNLKLSVKCL